MRLLSFDADTHVYFVDGVPVPSVSQVIEAEVEVYYDNPHITSKLENAKKRGTLVHKVIEYCLQGDMLLSNDYNELEIIEKTNEVFIRWLHEKKIVPLQNEYMLTNGMYAGTIDLLVEEDGVLTLVDVKATSVINKPLVELQLAGYYLLLKENGIEVNACKVLHIKTNTKGKYTYKYEEVSINIGKFKELLKNYG